MYGSIKSHLEKELQDIREAGLFKQERIITSSQGPVIKISTGQESAHPEVIQAAKDTLDSRGFGMSSVRFICGTQDIHKELEKRIADFYGTEDTILYAAAFDANGGVFEPLLGPEDAIISDALNHASIIDGVRLCKAKRYRYANGDMKDLESQLKQADKDGARFKLIVTDGVFSMDGIVAPLDDICDLADTHDALVMIDECHATGFIGEHGIGTLEEKGVMGRVDIITGTLGKALGGAMGGYTTGKKEIIEMLRQRSRPYLFSNSLAPAIVGASIKVFELLEKDHSLKKRLDENTAYFKKRMKEAGFDIVDGDSAIVPVMLYDAKLSQEMAAKLLDRGIYVIGFFYPVVPKGKARIRVQLSSAHEREHLDKAIDAFTAVGKELKVV
ncbi:MAG: glycine C-acetyltransferase [Robiginitalea sp.]